METINKLRYIFSRKQKVRFFMLTLIIIIGSAFELLGIVAITPLVSIIINPDVVNSNRIYSTLFRLSHVKTLDQFILLFIFALIAIYIIKNIYIIGMYSCQFRFTYNNQRRISMELMKSYMSQPYIFHLSKNVSELQRNMNTDTNMLFNAVLAFLQLMAEGITCFAIVIYLLIVDKSITIGIFILLSVFMLAFLTLTKRKSAKLGKISRDNYAKMSKNLRQAFEGIKEVKIANAELFFVDKVDEEYYISTEIQRKQGIINYSPKPLFEAVCITTMLGVVAIKVIRGVNISYFVPVLSSFVVAAYRLLPSFGKVTSAFNTITYNKAAVDNVYRDLKEVEELRNKRPEYADKSEIIFNNEIKIRNLTFTYPNTDNNILDDASFTINKDKSVALIGASGAGKTTLADIILGLLEPQKGNITVDGVDVFSKLYGWHNIVGYIPQTIYLLDDSIKNNIMFDVPEEDADENRLWQALDEAQLSDFVKSLDRGMETVVGERGVRLSGGQKQRIGIARALYKNPQVLILDEATSSLDNDTETAVMEAIDSLHGSRTMIIIAHRLSTIRNCDEVYEVKKQHVYRIDKNKLLSEM